MPAHLLTIPRELRLRILEYAVTLEPIVAYKSYEAHSHNATPPRGLGDNPHLSLYLICSQITGELMSVSIPMVQLKLCHATCVMDYFNAWKSMWKHVRCIEAPFDEKLGTSEDPEEVLKPLLLISAATWALRVDIVELRLSEISDSVLQRAEGRAIFWRWSS